ncbi:MAG: transglutaminase domain-containing protein [Gammaproteobacteria bacterium]|nr:transglutaminase domain-containing protein [Gammaproteobacteria bacterium]
MQSRPAPTGRRVARRAGRRLAFAPRHLGIAASIIGGGLATLALIVAAAAIWQFRPATTDADVAAQLAGERWYAVTFRHTPIGHYRSEAGRTDDGDFEFRGTLHFKLDDDVDSRIEDRLVFDRRSPHRLIRAEHASTKGERRVVIADNRAEIVESGSSRSLDADSDLELGDYLAVERWLATEAPEPGEVHAARSVDFDSLSIAADRWRVLLSDAGEFEVAKEARAAAAASGPTRIRMGGDLAPLRMDSGDLVSLHRVKDEATARIWEQTPSLFASARHRVEVDRPIRNPQALKRLVLALDHRDGHGIDWAGAPGATTLSAEADPMRPATNAELVAASAATVNYPANAPVVHDLASRAVGELEDAREKANALTLFVHHHLRYRDTAGGRTVSDTIRDGSGDCTEFADLYTTLARAAGLPARTVIGLAYLGESQAFALHAWNEVAIRGAWRGVDPTWGETRIGATHFPLPSDGALTAIAQLPNLRFRVVETEY